MPARCPDGTAKAAALKSAAIGYGLALLAPLIVTIVAGWVSVVGTLPPSTNARNSAT